MSRNSWATEYADKPEVAYGLRMPKAVQRGIPIMPITE